MIYPLENYTDLGRKAAEALNARDTTEAVRLHDTYKAMFVEETGWHGDMNTISGDAKAAVLAYNRACEAYRKQPLNS